MSDITKLDPNMAAQTVESELCWHDIRTLGVEGRGWDDTESFYNRLPARAKGVVPDPVWNLALRSAGMCVRFVTDATAISARWTLIHPHNTMNHMPASGNSGLDLYGLHEGRWCFAGCGRPSSQINEGVLVESMEPRRRQFVLNLPLYNGVTSVEIGVPAGATVEPAPPYDLADPRPICFYGTSINQGGCASRPGMTHTLILGRRLMRPIINLGFSGNGKSEIELANLLAELDPSVYVLDPLPNMNPQQVRERMGPFVRRLRQAHATTPIVLVENITYQQWNFNVQRRQSAQNKNAALAESFAQLIAGGVPNLHYVKGDDLLGHDTEGTVDGTHPTDVGFLRMADVLEPVLQALLG